jgi:WD40 repeat protein
MRATGVERVEHASEALDAAESGTYDAFLSYAREDSAFAVDRLREELRARSLRVWVDVDDIQGGAQWRDRVERGIEACKAFVFVVSPASVASAPCRDELAAAVASSKLVIPVIYRDPEQAALPAVIADAEWVFLRERDDQDAGLDKLVEALEVDLEWRDRHTRVAARAREWLDNDRDSSYLLRGSDLRKADLWFSEHAAHRQAPTPQQTEYIARSRQSASRRQRALVATLTSGLIVALGLAAFAFVQRHAAIDNLHISQSRQLAASAEANLATDPVLSTKLALRALDVQYTSQAEAALRDALPGFQLLRTLYVGASVADAALSPDGAQAATASDEEITVWNARTGARLRVLRLPRGVPDEPATAVAFSPDGRDIACAYDTGAGAIWEFASGRLLRYFPAIQAVGTGASPSVSFSPDGRRLLVLGVMWSVTTGQRLFTLHDPAPPIGNAAFSPDGQQIVSVDAAGAVGVWNARSGKRREYLTPQPSAYSASMNPTSTEIAVAQVNGNVSVVNAVTGHAILTLHGDLEPVVSTEFSPDGSEIVTASLDGSVRVWSAATATQLDQFDSHAGAANSAAFSHDGLAVVCGDHGGTAQIWDVQPRELIRTLAGVADGALYSPTGDEIVADGARGTVEAWDPATGSRRFTLEPPAGAGSSGSPAIAISPDGKLLAVALGPEVRIQNTATGESIREFRVPSASALSAVFSPSGARLAIASPGVVELLDLDTDKVVDSFRPPPADPDGDFTAASFDPSGTRLLTANVGGFVGPHAAVATIWDIATRSPARTVIVDPLTGRFVGAVGSAVFDPNGTQILTAGTVSGRVATWSAATGRQLVALSGYLGSVNDASFDVDGATIATAQSDGTVRLWNAGTGGQLAVLRASQGSVSTVAFDPIAPQLVATYANGEALVWSTELAGSLAAVERIARERLRAGLTTGEQEIYESAVG